MDQDRQIRFLYPPFFLFASLLLGIYLDPDKSLTKLLGGSEISFSESAGRVIGIILGGGTAVIALGFVISTVSISFLRLVFIIRSCCARRCVHFEATVSDDCLTHIWSKLGLRGPADKQKMLYAVVTFDHEQVSRPVHKWLGRRWSAFLISSHSITALAIALFIGWHQNVALTSAWISTSGVLMLLFLWAAIAAWMGNMRMIELQCSRGMGTKKGIDRKSDERAGVKSAVRIVVAGSRKKTAPEKKKPRGSRASQPRRSDTVSKRSRPKKKK